MAIADVVNQAIQLQQQQQQAAAAAAAAPLPGGVAGAVGGPGWNTGLSGAIGSSQILPGGYGGYQSLPTGYTGGQFDPLAYAGNGAGAQAYTRYYQGLGAAAAQQMGELGQSYQRNGALAGGAMYSADQQIAGGYAQGAQADARAAQSSAYGAGLQGALSLQNQAGQAYQDQMGAAGGAQKQADSAAGYGTQGLGMLANAAAGNGPSAAQAQLGAGVAQSIRAQMAAAASAKGGAYGQAAAQNQAAQQAGAMQSGAVGQAAQLRAQEQQSAMAGLTSAANQQYGTAGGLAQGYVSGAEGNALSGLGASSNAELQGVGLGNTAIQSGNELASQTAMQGQQLGQQADLGFSSLGQQGQLAALGMGMTAQQNYEGMTQNVQNNQLQAALQLRAQNLGLQENQAALQQAQLNSIVGGASAAGGVAFTMMSDENLKTEVAPQGDASPGSSMATAGQAAGQAAYGAANQANADGLSKEQLRTLLTSLRTGIGKGAQAFGQQMMAAGAAPPPSGIAQAPAPALGGAPIAAPIGGGMQPMVSDARAKTAVSPAPTADALLALLAKSKSTYSYRNPADQPLSPQHPRDPRARFGGVMAQDLERAPEIGRQLVTDTPRGKMLEPQSVMSAALMGLGRLAERVSALEGGGRSSAKPRRTGLSEVAREHAAGAQ